MKITCNREKMLNAFQIAAYVAPTRSPKPILQNVKLEVTDKGAVMIATDMEVGIRVSVEGIEIHKPGEVILPVDKFGSILRESSDENLMIEALDNGTIVQGDRFKFELMATNPEEFPSVAHFSETRFHRVQSRLLKELIRRTLFSVDTESGRFALSGVLLEMVDQEIIAVGSDGRRLAKMDGPAEAVEGHATEADAPTIVPSRAMQLIERALIDPEEMIEIAARKNDMLVRSPRFEIYTRLVEGKFPRWRDVIPNRDNSLKIAIQAGPLHASVRQAAIVADKESRGVDFKFSNGTLVIQGASDSAGQSRVELPISYDGEEIAATLDFRYVSEFLKVLDLEKNATLDVQDSESAALFTTDDGYAYVVMPLAKR